MLRIGTACGSGLGSSFMVQMNIESILSELGVTGVEVEHYDLGGADPSAADIWLVGRQSHFLFQVPPFRAPIAEFQIYFRIM